MLLAAILSFGQILYSAQGLQQAADVAAREISRTPLPAAQTPAGAPITLTYVLYGDASTDSSLQGVRTRVFDQSLLQVPLTSSNGSVLDAVKTWPIVNQMLFPLMIVVQDAAGDQWLVYPGMVPCTDSTGTLTVPCIARVDGSAASGTQTITWVPVIEEVTPPADVAAGLTPFSVSSPEAGLVSLRINFPYQSATMSGFQPPANSASPPGPPDNPVVPITVAGSQFTPSPTNQYQPTGTDEPQHQSATNGIYNGTYGLGQQYAWTTTVRPYRSFISAQAIYRREVFQ